MKSTSPKLTAESIALSAEKAWLAAREKVVKNSEVVPAGWLRAIDVMKLWKCKRAVAYDSLKKLVSNGTAESRRFNLSYNGKLRPVMHYKLL